MTNFICILGTRILRNTIKRYLPVGENKLNVYYNTSRNKPESETFVFNDSEERDEMIDYLDSIL
jgi:hypothetical protein